MKKLLLPAILIIVVLLVRCSNKKADQVNISEVNNKIALQLLHLPESGEKILNASYFADTIEFIPFETKAESLMDRVMQVWMDDSVFLVNCRLAGLLMFQRNGKFVRKIGKNGRGPEEYSSIIYFDVIRDTIYISSTGRRSLLRFTFNGTFCDEMHLKYQPTYFSSTAEKKLACYLNEKGLILVYNKNLFTPDTIVVEYGVTQGRYYWTRRDPAKTFLQKTPSGLLFSDYMNDTIWNIIGDRKELAFILDMKNKLPREMQIEFSNGNFEKWENDVKSYQFVHLVPFSSWMYIILKSMTSSTYDAIIFKNFETGEIKRFNTPFIYDDIVSKQLLHVAFYTFSTDYLVTIGSQRLKDLLQDQKEGKDPASSLWLKQMETVKEGDNPIFAVIKIKKNI